MQQTPFDEKHDVVTIRVHSMMFSQPQWVMDSSEPITGVPLSKPWIHHAEKTDLFGSGSLTANITLFLRNQSDYSNVIVVMGTYTVRPDLSHLTYERMLFLLTEFLFDKSSQHIAEFDLKGNNGEKFMMPPFFYTDDFFKKELYWTFQ